MSQAELRELKETLREKDFKLRAMSLVLSDLLAHAPTKIKERAHAALFLLSFGYTNGEKPFVFDYNGKKVSVE